jgi:cystathionine gamma-lyase
MSFRPDTIAIHAGLPNDPLTGAVVTPVYQTTTFAQPQLGGAPEYCYARTGNPTRSALERSLAALEGGRRGFAFASGLAAANALLQTLSAGDRVVAGRDLYGGCHRLFTRVFARFGVEFALIDTTDLDELRRALARRTALLWLETPSNPLLRVTDIAACAAMARERGVRVVVDNTFATPLAQRPLALGADVVLHSCTKYLGGHCDVLAGALVTSDPGLAESLAFIQNATGGVLGPWDSFLLLRGIRTLPLRVERHARNAQAVAEALAAHPEVVRVIYPGLASHPQHALAARQGRACGCAGPAAFGGILSIELRGGRERIGAIVGHLRLWALAESLGGVKSLLCHPATMTHAALTPAERARVGIGAGLLRLSVGLEDPADLIDDLDAALRATARTAQEAIA